MKVITVKKILMKSVLVLMMASGVLAPLSAQPVKAATALVGQVVNGDAVLYDAQGNAIAGGKLAVDSSWQLGKLISVGGKSYYEVATNEYVLQSDLKVTDSPSPVSDQVTPVNLILTTNKTAVIFDGSGNETLGRLEAGSSWKVDQSKTLGGVKYYRVATNEWIQAADMAESSQDSISTPVPVSWVGRVLYVTQLVDNNGQNVGRNLPVGTDWKIDKIVKINGSLYYRVGVNEWISASAIDVDADKIYNVKLTITTNKNAVVYNDDGDNTNYLLEAGTSWQTDQYKVINGFRYYRVASGEWVKAADLIDTLGGDGSTPTKVNWTGQMIFTAPLVDSNGVDIGKQLTIGSDWKISKVQRINGTLYYQVATNEWIPAIPVSIVG